MSLSGEKGYFFLAGAFFFAAFLAGAFFLAAFLAGAFFFAVAKSLTSFQRCGNDDERLSCSSSHVSRTCHPEAFTDFSVDSTLAKVFGPTFLKRGSRLSEVAIDVTGVFPLICIPPSRRR